jgi:cell division transport system permease protein
MSNIHIKTALTNIRRSPVQAFAAIFVLTITFFVITTLSVLVYSSNRVLNYFETRPQVIAFLKDEIPPADVTKLQQSLVNDPRVKDIRYVSKEEALAIYKDSTSDNPLLAELVSPSIFPASLEFSLTNLSYAKDVISQLKDEKIVDQVGFTANLGGEDTLQDTVERLRTLTNYLRWGGGVFVALLTTTSFTVLLVIISMRLVSRRQEVEILNLIGATSRFIKSPIMIEAVVYAFVGVFLGWLTSFILTLYASPSIISYFNQINVLPKSMLELLKLFGIVLVGEMIVGFFLAVVGSSLAVSRARKNK